MVATRTGVRVYSATRENTDECSGVPATPSICPRTRSGANQGQTPAQEKAGSQLDEMSSMRRCSRASRRHSPEQPSTSVGSCHEVDVSDLDSCDSAVSDTEIPITWTRGRRRQLLVLSQEEEETPEVESCLSVVSALKGDRSTHRSTRSMRKKIPESSDPVHAEVGDVEAESCGSVMLDSQRVTRNERRSACTRSSAKQQNEDLEASDADSCTSSILGGEVSSPTTSRATRYGRRAAITQLIPVQLDEASEGSRSPAPSMQRTRAAKAKVAASVIVNESQACDLDGLESVPRVTEQRMTRSRTKAKHLGQTAAMDSDSELTEVHSPQCRSGSAQDRGTPCSSRKGSGSSGRAVRATRLSAKAVTGTLESVEGRRPAVSTPIKPSALLHVRCQSVLEPADEGDELNGSKFEGKVITDPDCMMLEEDATLTLQEEDQESSVMGTEPTATDITPEEAEVVEVGHRGSVMVSITASQVSTDTTEKGTGEAGMRVEDETNSTADPQVSLSHFVTVSDPAVTAADQQREPSTENADGDASEMELSQEKPSAEPLQPHQSVTVAICENTATAEATEETKEEEPATDIGDAGTHTDALASQTEKLQDELSDGAAESLPDGEEEMEVSTSTKAQQLVGSSEVSPSPTEPESVQAKAIKVTSSQDQKVTVEPSPEQNPKNSKGFFQTTGISLLDSSDDEDKDMDMDLDEDVERNECSGEEEEVDHEDMGVTEDKGAGPSRKSELAAASVEGLFMIDMRPGQEANEQYYLDDLNEKRGLLEEEGMEQEEDEFVDEEVDDDNDDEDAQILFSSRNPQQKELSSRIDPGLRVKELGGLYVNFDGSKSKPVSSSLEKLQDEVMKKSVIGPDFEKKDAVPPYIGSKKALKLKHKAEREKTTGDGWFNMKAPELTQELKGDLKLLKMRGSLDPKRFYKKNDRDGFPKYFQVGTVVDNPVDFYHSRIPKKARKGTMVEELLVDAEFRRNNKKKYQQIMAEKAAHGAGKRNKKNKKLKMK
ncbi:deoxynucleotidyltransferase terminal-interacting protein 2 [Lampris incognitus]|uniref:deoxynucleotidyltransferase terminal-interacting protein 2 n=1 Tax=Lampris incognitus TaxID=2546036 RepID=UPI0024B52946|nr:deoxynucleotidyltransferase terminal-interacting protein 2 [Lampris incognitus]